MRMPTPEQMAEHSKTAYACSLAARRVTPCGAGWSRGGQPDSEECRRRKPHQALHLHHQGEPHLRSGVWRPGHRAKPHRQRRHRAVFVPGNDHAQPPQAGEAVRACSTTSTWTAKSSPTATSGRSKRLRHRLRGEGVAAELPRRQADRLRGAKARTPTRRRARAAVATSGTSGGGEGELPHLRRVGWRTASVSPTEASKDGFVRMKALEGKFDPKFCGYDLDYTDVKRGAVHQRTERLRASRRDAAMQGAADRQRPHCRNEGWTSPTVNAMVADQRRLALGMVVEAVSKGASSGRIRRSS